MYLRRKKVHVAPISLGNLKLTGKSIKTGRKITKINSTLKIRVQLKPYLFFIFREWKLTSQVHFSDKWRYTLDISNQLVFYLLDEKPS